MRPSSAPRVLHVAKSLGLGGTEKAMQLLVAHLDKAAFSPFVYSPADGPRRAQIKAAGVPVIVGGDIRDVMERLRPDIVHVHRAGWAEPGLLAPIIRARPRALVETNVFGRYDQSPSGQAIDLHLLVSPFCRERLLRHHPQADPARYAVLPNPIDTDLFTALYPEPDYASLAAVRVSRPDPGKWSRLSFEMLPHLKRLEPGFRLLVLGSTPEFLDFLRTQGLEDNVETLPQVEHDSELAAVFQRASVFAHGTDTGESFGMAIAEAMAAGLPVVTHPAEGQRDNAHLDLVAHGVTGLVAHTAEDYAQALAFCWRNPDEARRMGRAGREKAAEYRVQQVALQLKDFYAALLAGR